MSSPGTEGPAPALLERYDLAMLDLDGVVYVGPDAVPGAADHLAAARRQGLRIGFVTNNASRTPAAVAAHLSELGVPADADDVVTSAQAAAHVLVDRLGPGANVVALGAEGLRAALEEVGLVPVDVEADADALVTGYGPDVVWRDVMRAAVRIRDGLWWVASNTDATIPTPYGVAPGHGVLVDTLRRFAGVDPVVAGKPARPLLTETIRRLGSRHPLMVGDRLDTDIAGAAALGIDSLLVMTGVSGLAELVGAAPEERPTHVAADLSGLLDPPGVPERSGAGWALGGWTLKEPDGAPVMSGGGSASDWWRVVAAWAGDPSRSSPPDPERLGALVPPDR